MDWNYVVEQVLKFRDDRDWGQFHNPKDLAMGLTLEACELQEKFLRMSQEKSREVAKNNEEVNDEIADIIYMVMLFAHECNIDVEKAVLNKLERNNLKYKVEQCRWRCDKYTKYSENAE